MRKQDEKKSIKKELKKNKTAFIEYNWIIKIILLSFVISFGFSFFSETLIPNVDIIIGIIILLIVVIIGVIFDMIGVAVQSADEKPFHSMNSRRIKGADIAVKFKKNTDKVSSFCNDVVGDICGIVSGTASSIIAVNLATIFNWNHFITVLIITAIISSLTIGGKAIGKSIAVNKSNYILYSFAKFISNFYKIKK